MQPRCSRSSRPSAPMLMLPLWRLAELDDGPSVEASVEEMTDLDMQPMTELREAWGGGEVAAPANPVGAAGGLMRGLALAIAVLMCCLLGGFLLGRWYSRGGSLDGLVGKAAAVLGIPASASSASHH